MKCKRCGEDSPDFANIGELSKHRWAVHPDEAIAQVRKPRRVRQAQNPDNQERLGKPASYAGTEIAAVGAPKPGSILFHFGSQEIPMNPFEMTHCYEYYLGIQRRLNLSDSFTSVLEDAMDMMYGVLVEGYGILPPGPLTEIETVQDEEEDDGRSEGIASEENTGGELATAGATTD